MISSPDGLLRIPDPLAPGLETPSPHLPIRGGPPGRCIAFPDDLRNPVQNPVCLTTSRFLPTTTATSSPQQADSANPAQSVGVFLGRIAHHASIGMGGLS
jgi:hypothetical protein